MVQTDRSFILSGISSLIYVTLTTTSISTCKCLIAINHLGKQSKADHSLALHFHDIQNFFLTMH